MAKIMFFIDGTWLYANSNRLAQAFGKSDYRLDFGKLPHILAQQVNKQLGSREVDIVRTYLFGSFPINYDLRDEEMVQRQKDFFAMLKEEYHYEVELFPVNFLGRRVRRADRDAGDTFEPKEKCVDISLATSMLYFAAIPYAYDIAIAVVGDQDFKPVLQHVRRLGKRVAIASIRGSCAPQFYDPCDEARVKDFDIIWLDDLLSNLELKYEPHLLRCESPIHKGDALVWTTFHPRKGQKFYCDNCRAEFARQKSEQQQSFIHASGDELEGKDAGETEGVEMCGTVTRKFAERGYGFIQSLDGRSYYFHLTDLEDGFDFKDVAEGIRVVFEVKRDPAQDKAGAAQNVRRSLDTGC